MRRLREQEGTPARALEFAVLTAGRTSEVLGAKRSEIDRASRMWTVPADRMKGRREHRVPLCDAALAIVDATPRGEYLFPGAKKGKQLGTRALTTLLERMGLGDQVTTHGFRSTFRDWASETTNYPGDMLELAIAHAIDSKTEAAYRRADQLAKRFALMADWQRHCESADIG
jgi:integrase